MLKFRGDLVFLRLEEKPWSNPETGQQVVFRTLFAYSNTGFNKGPQCYVYELKLSRKAEGMIDQIKTWPKNSTIKVHDGLITSVSTPTKNDPTRNWTKVGLLINEIQLAMQQIEAPKEYELPPMDPDTVSKLDEAFSGFEEIPF